MLDAELWINSFSYSTLKILFYFLLVCKVSNKKAMVIVVFYCSVCYVLFSSVCLQDFIFFNLIVICLGIVFFTAILLTSLRFLNLFIIKCGKILVIISSGVFFCPIVPPILPSNYAYIRCFDTVPQH